MPNRAYSELGSLIIRDFTGDRELLEQDIVREARNRGAEGAWIQGRSVRKDPGITTQSVGSRGQTARTGEIQSDFVIVEVLLFNYVYTNEGGQ